MLPLVAAQWIGVVLFGLYAGKYALPQFGFDLFVDRPAPTATGNAAKGGGNGGQKPPQNSILRDMVTNPSSIWALAGLGLVSVFVIAQVRAAGHDTAQGVRGLYREAQAGTANLSNPDTSIPKRR